MFKSKMKTYSKERDKLVRHCLHDMAAENGWEVVNEIREGNVVKQIYRIK